LILRVYVRIFFSCVCVCVCMGTWETQQYKSMHTHTHRCNQYLSDGERRVRREQVLFLIGHVSAGDIVDMLAPQRTRGLAVGVNMYLPQDS
jgi:hypothetical protein